MKTRAAWPERPPVEDDTALEAHLDAIDAAPPVRRFCRDLAQHGLARIDLGDEARRLCDCVAAEMERRFAKGGVRRLEDFWLRSAATRRLATLPAVERLLAAAYGRPPFAFQTLNFRIGTQQRTHADTIHFNSVPERFMCGVWTALEDISEDAGPLLYHPGSHTLSVLTMKGAGVNDPHPAVEAYATHYLPAQDRRLEAAGLPSRKIVLRKGEAVVWTANLAHGGAPILNPNSTRRSLVTHFFFKDCLYYTPMTSDVEEGRFSVRLPANVRTGGVERPRLNGRHVPVSRGQIVDAARKLVLRRVNASW